MNTKKQKIKPTQLAATITEQLKIIEWADDNRSISIIRLLETYQSSKAVLNKFRFCREGRVWHASNVKVLLTMDEYDPHYYEEASFDIILGNSNIVWSFKNIPYDNIDFSKSGMMVFEKDKELNFAKIQNRK